MSEQPTHPKEKRRIVPLWVAVAGLVLAIGLAVLVVTWIAAPLAELVLDTAPDIPLPDGAKLESETTDTGRAQHEWLYSLSNSDGCAVAEFFREQGASCAYTPLACDLEPEIGILRQIATCTKTEKQLIDGYTWEVLISTEYHEDETSTAYFRVYLYD